MGEETLLRMGSCALLEGTIRNLRAMTVAGCLAWRPVHLPSSQQMQVKVVNGLATIGSGVDDDAKTAVEMLPLCNFVGSGEQLTEKFNVARAGVRE